MNKKRTNFQTPGEFFRVHSVCIKSQMYALKFSTTYEAWENCPNPTWLLGVYERMELPIADKTLRLFACNSVRQTPIDGARTVLSQLTDERSLNTLAVAERFAKGEATEAELTAAHQAAFAAAQAESSPAAKLFTTILIDASIDARQMIRQSIYLVRQPVCLRDIASRLIPQQLP